MDVHRHSTVADYRKCMQACYSVDASLKGKGFHKLLGMEHTSQVIGALQDQTGEQLSGRNYVFRTNVHGVAPSNLDYSLNMYSLILHLL